MEAPIDKRRIIFEAATRAKQLLETLKNGYHVMDTKGHEPEVVAFKLCDLLHFRQYVQMYKFAFETWDLSGTEQTYLEVGGEARQLHLLLDHDVFKETLFSLLWIRSEFDGKTIEETHDEYMNLIGQQWINAGLISCV